MKKKILSLIIGMILLAGLVSAVALFTNREQMLDYFRTYKQNREANVKEMISTINFIKDKECQIHYFLEEVFCDTCFEYNVSLEYLNISSNEAKINRLNTINNYVIFQDCVDLDEFSSEEEDNQKVVEYVKRRIDSLIPIEEIGYKARDMKDIKIIM